MTPPDLKGSDLLSQRGNAIKPAQRVGEVAYNVVKSMIMDHVLAPNERINIDRLAREVNISQTPLREALARLASEGLVTNTALVGYSTTALMSGPQMEDLYQLRMLIEPWSAAQAAFRIAPDMAARLTAEMLQLSLQTDVLTYMSITAHDARFHDLVHEAGGNQAVRAAFERTHCHLHIFRLYGSYEFDDQEIVHSRLLAESQALIEHQAITDAIISRDPTAASATMTQHLEQSQARLRRIPNR